MWGKRAVSFRYMLAASCFVLILFSVLSVSVLAGREMAATVEENTVGSVRNVFEQSNQELRRQLEEIEAAYSAAAIDVTLIDAVRLENAQDSVYDKYLNFHQIEKILKNACKNHPMLDNVALYTPHGNLLLANSGTSAPYREELPAQPWFGELRSGALQRYVAGNFELTLSPAPYEQTKTVYLLAQRFYDYRDMRYLGVLLFAADTRAFYDTIDALPLTEGMGLAILDRDRRVLHARGLSPAFCEGLARQEAPADGAYRAVGDGKYFIVGQTYEALGWELVSATPRAEMLRGVSGVWRFTWRLALAVALLGAAFVILLVHRMHRPIRQIEDAIVRFGGGALDVRLPDTRYAEFQRIGDRFNLMAGQIDTLICEVREKEREKQRVHMRMLEAQINPHFIYNTLDGIKWVAMMHGEGDVARMITALVKLLRVSVYTEQEFISVREELEYLKNYLTLIEMRYGAQIEFSYDAPDEALACRTLKLVLQPLVENAIFHGLLGKVEHGRVRVTYRVEDCLVLEVADNGVGCASTARSEAGRDRFSGIGLDNIDRRVKLWCGEEYGVTVRSAVGGGTTVTVRQKLRREGEDE